MDKLQREPFETDREWELRVRAWNRKTVVRAGYRPSSDEVTILRGIDSEVLVRLSRDQAIRLAGDILELLGADALAPADLFSDEKDLQAAGVPPRHIDAPVRSMPCPGFPDCECGKPHTADGARVDALAPPEPPTKAWLLTERRKDGRIVNEAIALTNDAAREWVSDPNMEFGQARSSLPLKVFPAPPRADALDAPPADNNER